MSKRLLSLFIPIALVAPLASAQSLGVGVGTQSHGAIGVSTGGIGISSDNRLGANARADFGDPLQDTTRPTRRAAKHTAETTAKTGAVVRDDARTTASESLQASEQAQAAVAGNAGAAANSVVPTASGASDSHVTGSVNSAAGLDAHASDTGVSASAAGQATAAAASEGAGDASAPAKAKDKPTNGKRDDATP